MNASNIWVAFYTDYNEIAVKESEGQSFFLQ